MRGAPHVLLWWMSVFAMLPPSLRAAEAVAPQIENAPAAAPSSTAGASAPLSGTRMFSATEVEFLFNTVQPKRRETPPPTPGFTRYMGMDDTGAIELPLYTVEGRGVATIAELLALFNNDPMASQRRIESLSPQLGLETQLSARASQAFFGGSDGAGGSVGRPSGAPGGIPISIMSVGGSSGTPSLPLGQLPAIGRDLGNWLESIFNR